MAPVRSTTVRDLRRGNRTKVLWELYLGGSTSRQQLTVRTGLSAGTVTNVTNDLLAEGIVVEVGSEESRGGRPRGVVGINPSYGAVIGVDVGEQTILIELFDMAMNVLASQTSQLKSARMDPDEVVRVVLEGIQTVIDEAGVDPSTVVGAGVGVPGVVEHEPDGLVHGQSVGWESVPIGRMLRAGTSVPILVDNGAKTRGQGEMWFGAGRGARNAVVALIGTGVGASIIADGSLYRGATSSAGEWGHTTSEVGGRFCRCGSWGCLEAYVGAGYFTSRYAELTGKRDTSTETEEVRTRAIIARADSDADAAQVLDEWITRLGAGLADLVNLFNPERIIIGGWLGRLLAPDNIDRIRAATGLRALAVPLSHTDIRAGELGTDAGALGAATLPVEQLITNGALHTAPAPAAARRPVARPASL
jgi:predicted NBD/HSP70 family sugar kinase